MSTFSIPTQLEISGPDKTSKEIEIKDTGKEEIILSTVADNMVFSGEKLKGIYNNLWD